MKKISKLFTSIIIIFILLFTSSCSSNNKVLNRATKELTYELILKNNISKDEVTTNLNLVKKINNVAISWESDNTDVISNKGIVNQKEQDITVTLTATLKYKNKSATKQFTLTVLKSNNTLSYHFDFNNLERNIKNNNEESFFFIKNKINLQDEQFIRYNTTINGFENNKFGVVLTLNNQINNSYLVTNKINKPSKIVVNLINWKNDLELNQNIIKNLNLSYSKDGINYTNIIDLATKLNYNNSYVNTLEVELNDLNINDVFFKFELIKETKHDEVNNLRIIIQELKIYTN